MYEYEAYRMGDGANSRRRANFSLHTVPNYNANYNAPDLVFCTTANRKPSHLRHSNVVIQKKTSCAINTRAVDPPSRQKKTASACNTFGIPPGSPSVDWGFPAVRSEGAPHQGLLEAGEMVVFTGCTAEMLRGTNAREYEEEDYEGVSREDGWYP